MTIAVKGWLMCLEGFLRVLSFSARKESGFVLDNYQQKVVKQWALCK